MSKLPTIEAALGLGEAADFEVKLGGGKDGKGELPRSFWETYVAMANTDGGRIVVGVRDHGAGGLEVVGLQQPARVQKRRPIIRGWASPMKTFCETSAAGGRTA